jgi:predicted enzyme related to lactoylglutathione lyase
MSNADIRGRFMWHELMTTDTDAASAFYSKVMPWKTQASGMPGYTLWLAGKTQAGGLMALPAESQGAGPHWLTYIGTPSVDSSVEGVQRLGGKVLKAASDIPNVGRFAVVSDPQGAAFALYTPASAPTDGAGPAGAAPGGASWHELSTTDVNGAVAFYTELFGWEKGPGHDMGGDVGVYQLITQGGKQIGGMFKSPHASMPPSWLTYVHVTDIDKAANAVKGGGGRIMNGPHQVPGGSWIVQAMDPQGGMFAVIEPAEMAAAEKPAQPAKAAAKPAAAPPAAKPAAAKEAKPAAATAAKPAAPAPEAKAPAPKAAPRKAAAKSRKKAAKKAAPKPAKKRAAAKRGAAKKASGARGAKKGAAKGKAKARAKARVKAKGKRR